MEQEQEKEETEMKSGLMQWLDDRIFAIEENCRALRAENERLVQENMRLTAHWVQCADRSYEQTVRLALAQGTDGQTPVTPS